VCFHLRSALCKHPSGLTELCRCLAAVDELHFVAQPIRAALALRRAVEKLIKSLSSCSECLAHRNRSQGPLFAVASWRQRADHVRRHSLDRWSTCVTENNLQSAAGCCSLRTPIAHTACILLLQVCAQKLWLQHMSHSAGREHAISDGATTGVEQRVLWMHK
jgi:hypothetical protein